MDCLLVRHGIAVEREEWDGDERERPLTEKGLVRTAAAAEGLRSLETVPSHLLSSPYTRAHQTAEIIRRLVCRRLTIETAESLAPDGSSDALSMWVNELPPEAVVLCVGHEPHLSRTAGIWLTGRACEGLVLRKAGACLIRFEQGVASGRGRLLWWLTPAQLRSLGRGRSGKT